MGLSRPVRFTTWLSPGLPEALFEAIAASIVRDVGRSHQLEVETRFSGPTSPDDDLFARDETDVGFLCPPSFLWLSDRSPPSVTLVPLAPVYDDPRNQGRPVYYSDLVVRSDSPVSTLADLAGCRIGYNDAASLSGYVSIVGGLRQQGFDPGAFAEFVPVGSHHEALAGIEAGVIDAAAVDSYTWRHRGEAAGGLGSSGTLRSAFAFGPFPIQPIVVRAGAAAELVPAVARALAGADLIAEVRSYGVNGFAPVSMADYQVLAPLLGSAR